MNIHFRMFITLYRMGYFKAPRVRTIDDLDNFLNRRKKSMKIDIDRNDERKLFEALYQENQQLKQQLAETEESYNSTMKYLNKTRSELLNLPKKIVKDIIDVADDYWDYEMCKECGNIIDFHTISKKDFDEVLATILEKYEGDKNE